MVDKNQMSINEILALEQSISKMVQNLKENIIKKLKTQTNPDYKPINHLCGVIRFSALQKGESWAPEYWIPESQAKFIESALKDVKTITSLQKKIKELIETKTVKIGCNKHKINPITVDVLKKYL